MRLWGMRAHAFHIHRVVPAACVLRRGASIYAVCAAVCGACMHGAHAWCADGRLLGFSEVLADHPHLPAGMDAQANMAPTVGEAWSM